MRAVQAVRDLPILAKLYGVMLFPLIVMLLVTIPWTVKSLNRMEQDTNSARLVDEEQLACRACTYDVLRSESGACLREAGRIMVFAMNAGSTPRAEANAVIDAFSGATTGKY